ncbi:MAG: CAP domain-containing protein [Meiothermus ruber]|uniref:CAP domain-containing protein n=1 Tax=Meiothermus ruber TaxID=277 RepID=UPI00391A230A|nr:CAP domain-containing protein [Meiothermus ruber]
MKQSRFYSLWVILVLLIVACGSAPSSNNTRFVPYPEEAQVLGLVNAFRSQARACGAQQFAAAPALTWVEAVGDAAWFHSIDMGRANSDSHQGASTADRLRARGFDPGPVAEHRSRTRLPANPNDAFSAWAADPVACANMMNPTFTVMGAGLWGEYEGGNTTGLAFWTHILTTPRSTTPPPTPTPILSISPTTSTVTVGGSAIAFSATLTNSTASISWILVGPGSLSATTGVNTSYTPPTAGGASTAIVSARAGDLTATAAITINAATPIPTLDITPIQATVNVGGAAITFTATTNTNQTIGWALGANSPGSISSTIGNTTSYTPPATGGAGTAFLCAAVSINLSKCATITINAAAPTLTVSPITATTQVGGANVIITASSNQVSWSMTGPGTFSWAGSTFTYIPPTSGNGGTTTVTATLGTLTASAVITITPPAPPPPPDLAPFLALINEFRSQPRVCMNGAVAENMPAVPPVAFQDQLNTAARLHSEDMAANNYFSHTGLNGSTFVTRIAATGYTGAPQGENIAAGNANVQGAFDSWRNSNSGHCQAMMSASSNEIGLGYGFNSSSQWTHYWTLVFGKRN